MFCQRKFGVVLLRCDGALSLYNWIFNSPYVIERHSLVSLVRSLKFISK